LNKVSRLPGSHEALWNAPARLKERAQQPPTSDVQDDWAAVGAERIDPATKLPGLVATSVVRSSELFREPTMTRHPFMVEYSAEEYTANLSTQSGVKQLPVQAQAELLGGIERRIRAQGNTLTVHHIAVLTVAQRVTPAS
jgi:hypothetical protein